MRRASRAGGAIPACTRATRASATPRHYRCRLSDSGEGPNEVEEADAECACGEPSVVRLQARAHDGIRRGDPTIPHGSPATKDDNVTTSTITEYRKSTFARSRAARMLEFRRWRTAEADPGEDLDHRDCKAPLLSEQCVSTKSGATTISPSMTGTVTEPTSRLTRIQAAAIREGSS